MTSNDGMAAESLRSRPVILAFNRTYLPGFKGGGPIRTLTNMVEQLGHALDFRIVTQDRDAGDSVPYAGIAEGTWTPLGSSHVCYLSPAAVTLQKMTELIRRTRPDVIYLNSFFDRLFTQRVLIAKWAGSLPQVPVVIAPRGEFSPGALGCKRYRKQVYLTIFRAARLYRDIFWQASTALERDDIRRVLPSVPSQDVAIACDLAAPAAAVEVVTNPTEEGQPLKVLFLSRITPMKNLVYAIELLHRVRCPVVFTVSGPRQDDYWAECQRKAKTLPSHVSFEYLEAVPPSEVPVVMRRHDLFLLPTLGENFGHVIQEALSVGLPVLISDRTPWSRVRDVGAGWALPLDHPDAFVEVIEHLSAVSGSQRLAMRQAAAAFGRDEAFNRVAINDNLRLFTHVINSSRGAAVA